MDRTWEGDGEANRRKEYESSLSRSVVVVVGAGVVWVMVTRMVSGGKGVGGEWR